jgi:hypothetical protein
MVKVCQCSKEWVKRHPRYLVEHGVESTRDHGDMIRWYVKIQEWVIEMNSLEDLQKFINEYGQVIVRQHQLIPEYPFKIIIYDDCVE